MQFQKIAGFKKMTEEAMKNTTGGGNTDTLQQKTFKPIYGKTSTTCGTGSQQNADPCTIIDVNGMSQD